MSPLNSIPICIVGSLVASFLLFAITFKTPFAGLREAFIPVYAGLIALCLIGSAITPKHILPVIVSSLLLPSLMLLYIASQKSDYLVDTFALISICYAIAYFTSHIILSKEEGNKPPKTKMENPKGSFR